jgi:hypothetical protein
MSEKPRTATFSPIVGYRSAPPKVIWWLGQDGLDGTEIANASGTAGLVDDSMVEDEGLSEHQIPH